MDLHNKLNLLSLNCNGFKNKANIILDTYPNIDLFCFQEYWLSSEECSMFNTNNNSYSGYGNVSFDNTTFFILTWLLLTKYRSIPRYYLDIAFRASSPSFTINSTLEKCFRHSIISYYMTK